jgi:DNA (cytosine-5)-methyltransferase 1
VAFKSEKHLKAFKLLEEELLVTNLELESNALESCIDFSGLQEEKYYYNPEKNPSFYSELAKSVVQEGVIYQWRRQYVRANKSGVAPTLTANMGMGGHNVPIIKTSNTTFSPDGIRKLTPEECFALMGFKDAKSKFPEKVVDSRLYKQAGNAVVVDVIEAIATRIKTVLDN